jgi:protein-disulfide isomerase
MIPSQVNRVRALWIVAIALACAPTNGGKQTAAAARRDSASVAPAAAPADPDGAKADLARIQGSATAPVWVIEVSDFQCPFCRQWHDQTYKKLRDEFVRTGKVRLAYVNFPLAQHEHAWPAAEAAMCAGAQGKFWEMHDALFTTQQRWESLGSAAPVFDSLARATGVDPARWQQCVQSGKMRAWIQADHDRAQRAGASSTPTFMIGNRMLVGMTSIEQLRSAIDTALARSKKLAP